MSTKTKLIICAIIVVLSQRLYSYIDGHQTDLYAYHNHSSLLSIASAILLICGIVLPFVYFVSKLTRTSFKKNSYLGWSLILLFVLVILIGMYLWLQSGGLFRGLN